MVEINDSGLFIIESGEVIPVHTSGPEEDDIESLNEYIENWDLDIDE